MIIDSRDLREVAENGRAAQNLANDMAIYLKDGINKPGDIHFLQKAKTPKKSKI